MNDIDGNEVESGDLIGVLSVDSDFLSFLEDETERKHHLAMVNHIYIIDEIVEDGSKASVSIQWKCAEGIAIGDSTCCRANFAWKKST